ncbi:hypothetical protein ACP70R_015726 [Stipagrostis hirtigluma subsp. patula]
MKDNEKKAVLVVQSLRNVIMGSTLVATTSVLLCTGVAAVLSSTYAVKKPLSDAVFGAHGELVVALKYAALLSTFLLAFLCHSLAICALNQATFLVNALSPAAASAAAPLRLPGVTGTTSPTSWSGASCSTSPGTGSSSPARHSCSGSSAPSCRASAPSPWSRSSTTWTWSCPTTKGSSAAATAPPSRRWRSWTLGLMRACKSSDLR